MTFSKHAPQDTPSLRLLTCSCSWLFPSFPPSESLRQAKGPHPFLGVHTTTTHWQVFVLFLAVMGLTLNTPSRVEWICLCCISSLHSWGQNGDLKYTSKIKLSMQAPGGKGRGGAPLYSMRTFHWIGYGLNRVYNLRACVLNRVFIPWVSWWVLE